MNRVRGVRPIRSVGWCVLPCPRSGMATASTGAKALPYVHHATSDGLFRSLPLA
jgi:hypothetical protein